MSTHIVSISIKRTVYKAYRVLSGALSAHNKIKL